MPQSQMNYWRAMVKAQQHSMRGFWGGIGGLDPLKNDKAIAFLNNTGSDPLENHKAIKPAV